ncbi:WYL domain-containing protein [Qipengyuania marisflavi]|uniref:WYL domain-containing protein n=1 Tax=Qipengyuania marisflavi TaxID=2486356 RepID=A0A5S3P5Y7_9SPHN|nr:WYL domain-containing protein [Qipengyuania marisflavi]TMM48346.1 WYL domain-containing protein [Qipengyuania marisflavi]
MQHNSPTIADLGQTLAQAIRNKQMVQAVYNAVPMDLAPHQIFVRNDALYVSAFNPQKKRREDESPALGHFKIAGLTNLHLTQDQFAPLPEEGRRLPRESDQLIFAID